jgi:hypothetical protein
MTAHFTKLFLTGSFLLLLAEAALPGVSQAAASGSPGSGVTPGGDNGAFERVAAHIDPGGSIYIYWNTEKLLGEIDRKLQSIRDTAIAGMSLTADQKERLAHGFDLARRLVMNCGIEAVKAFGMSSHAISSGYFLNRSFLYVPDRSGYLWRSFAKPSHDFGILKMVPQNTEGFAFFDFDLAILWEGLSNDLEASGIPELTNWRAKADQEFQSAAGMSLDDFLGSLGDQVGLIFTLDPQRTTPLPVGNTMIEIPEPGGALLWKVNNDKVFDRLDALLSTTPGVERTDQPDFRIRVLKKDNPTPYLSPTLARYRNYLIVSSSENLVRGIIDADIGRTQGVRSFPDYNGISEGMPASGNQVAYVGKRLQEVVASVQTAVCDSQAAGDPLLRSFVDQIAASSAETASYAVSGATADGWFSTAKTTKDVNDILGDLLIAPAYFLATAAVQDLKRGGTSAEPQERGTLPQPPAAQPGAPAPTATPGGSD